jgi:UrcA family protein
MNGNTVIGAIAISLALASNPSVVVARSSIIADVQQSDQGFNQVTVRVADLNLTSEAGAKALHERIQAASNRVCIGVDHDTYGFSLPASGERCRFATHRAVKPLVDAAIARARSGQRAANGLTIQSTGGDIAVRR